MSAFLKSEPAEMTLHHSSNTSIYCHFSPPSPARSSLWLLPMCWIQWMLLEQGMPFWEVSLQVCMQRGYPKLWMTCSESLKLHLSWIVVYYSCLKYYSCQYWHSQVYSYVYVYNGVVMAINSPILCKVLC